MFAFVKKLFEPRKRVPARRRPSTRPGLEMLEGRLVMSVANPLGATSLLGPNPVVRGAVQTQPIGRTDPSPVTKATLSPDGTTIQTSALHPTVGSLGPDVLTARKAGPEKTAYYHHS